MKTSGLRILHVITPSRMAGAETLLARLAPRQIARGNAVVIVCTRSRNRQSRALDVLRAASSNIEIGNSESRNGESKAARQIAEVWELPVGGKIDVRAALVLKRAARRFGAQILHTHLSSASWWAGWLDAAGVVPSVGHVHGFTSAIWHRHQSALIACSQAVKNHLVEQGIAAAKIHVLLNPVSPDDVKISRTRAEIRAEIGAENDTPIVGCFAHLSEKKGWRELMQAANRVLETFPNAQFWCAGDGPLRAELEEMARVGGFQKNVKFLGFRSDIADLMNAIDVFALPSHREPFGLVYVEAALHGKACVACDAGGAPEVVRDGESGFLVPPHDSQKLADAIIKLLGDRELSTRLGENGRAWALKNCDWDTFLDGLERVYATARAGK